jgi:hypothetical protein
VTRRKASSPSSYTKSVVVATPPASFDMETALSRGSRAAKTFTPSDADYDSFIAALEPWARADDISALLNFLRSHHTLTAGMRHDLAALIEMLYARTRPRAQGKPGGKQQLYRNPNHWAAYIVREAIARWKTETGKQRVPNDVTEDLIKRAIENVSTWKVAQEFGRRLRSKTVREILRKPRHRSF